MDQTPLLQPETPDQSATPSDRVAISSPPPTLRQESATKTIALSVDGMRCAGCVKVVEDRLKACDGVVAATVNLVTQTAIVEGQADVIHAVDLAQVVTDAGFPTQPRSQISTAASMAEREAKRRQETRQYYWRGAIAGFLLLFSAFGHLEHLGWVASVPGLSNIWFHWGLATLALAIPGRDLLRDGWKGLRHGAPNMNTLVGLGTLSAYTASVVALLWPQLGWECFFDEPVMLLSFILIGRTLEHRARSRAARAFESLVQLQPNKARLVSDPNRSGAPVSIELPIEQIQVGEWVQVLPSEKFPVDGDVVQGQTTVDESMLTGESTPVLKQAGDAVAAGTVNQSGAVILQVTRTGADTTLAQMIALVEDAQTRKAPIQRLADTVAGYFTYGVLTIAALTFAFWYFIGLSIWPDVLAVPTEMPAMMTGMVHHATTQTSPLLFSLKLAIAVMVVACPCALGLATPTAILVGTGLGAERGLLIRGGDVLETVHQLDTVVFDKTGTLTTGQPKLTDCMPLQSNYDDKRLIQLAATVESGTRHPLAEAIRRAADERGLTICAADEFTTQPGLGISAVIDQQQVYLGNRDWLVRQDILIDDAVTQQAESLSATGTTVVFIAVEQQVVGLLGIRDTLRPDAVDVVKQLQPLHIMLITGDQATTATAIATSLGLDETAVLANVKPDEKVKAITQLQQQGQRVAMVGDGINDAPALAQADVGIALNSGTDIAIEAADIILMRDRLLDVVEAINLSQATFNKIRQNLFWALAYNAVGIPVAAGVLLPAFGIAFSPAIAGALMAFSSVSVVTNSLLLRRR